MDRFSRLGVWCGLGLWGCGGPWSVTLTIENTSTAGALVASDGSTHDIKLAPGVVILHDETFSLFAVGEAASAGLEALAEDGDPALLQETLAATDSVRWFEVVSTITGETYAEAPLFPGDAVSVTVTAERGERLTLAQMFGESNDVFLATVEPLTIQAELDGEQRAQVALFDAGTEVNQEPGLGADQAPRQAAPNTGSAEDATVQPVQDTDAAGWSYPPLEGFFSWTVTLQEPAAGDSGSR